MQASLGKLITVPVRSVWPDETKDFTPWLAKSENLNLLAKELGFREFELISEEQQIDGPDKFKVDIYASIPQIRSKVIIENQLDESDHKHLGELITYASGLNANYVVWIVTNAREAHQQAIDWLNENISESINFFLVKVSVLQIDDSQKAVQFSVLRKPNGWLKQIKQSYELSETQNLILEYWEKYYEIAKQNSEFMKYMNPMKPSHRSWTNISIGKGDRYRLSLSLSPKNDRVCIEINTTENADLILRHQIDFENLLECSGVPYNADTVAGIRFYKENCNLKSPDQWDELINWQLQAAIKLRGPVLEVINNEKHHTKEI